MFKGIFDEIACAITGRRIIRFDVAVGKIPYEVLQYLESVGVVVWPGQATVLESQGYICCNIHVRESQYDYAAGLVAGLRDEGVFLTEPKNVRPIQPRSSWGRPTRARGVMAGILRSIATSAGLQAKAPPAKR